MNTRTTFAAVATFAAALFAVALLAACGGGGDWEGDSAAISTSNAGPVQFFPAGSGTLAEVVFTPITSGTVSLSAAYRADASTGPGTAQFARAYCTQSGATSDGQEFQLDEGVKRYSLRSDFHLIAGEQARCGLIGGATQPSMAVFFDVEVSLSTIS